MARQNGATVALNRGLISRKALARVDLNRTALAAEEMTNWRPVVLGAMSLRPGIQYLGETTRSNAVARCFPFVFTDEVSARLEVSAGYLRVWRDDELVTRESVTATMTNGEFTSDLTGWTDNDESGAASAWATGGYLALLGTGTNAAIRDQAVTVNEANVLHSLRITIQRGPAILRVGSTSGGDEYISETTLGTGTHSLAFTPTGATFYIRLMNRRLFTSLVSSVSIDGAGVLELPVPWDEADLPNIRMSQESQSADVIYVACRGFQQRKIERRDNDSWSIVLYEPENGPFRVQNTTPITITPSAISGDIALTASKALFASTHVGALFKLPSTGQLVTVNASGADQFSDPIRVSGIEEQRSFQIAISGTWTATVTLQYSVGEPGAWVDVRDWTANASQPYLDELDNQVIYYRIGVKAGDYTSGTVVASLSFASGSISGVVRITSYSSPTSVSGIVLKALGGTTGTASWSEGLWSDRRGYPSAPALFEGRLCWAGMNFDASVVDGYEDFDEETEGDSGPISRTIGEGPITVINWMVPLNRLLIGTLTNSADVPAVKVSGNSVLAGRSSNFDDPLSPTNFNLKNASPAAAYIHRSGKRLMLINFDATESDYKPQDMSVAVPDLNRAGILQIAVQYEPDLRFYCRRSDGTYSLMTHDAAENVVCWTEEETDGTIEDISILPGEDEDQVYVIVERGGIRYHGKFAMESECSGQPEAYLSDYHFRYAGADTDTISGLHFEDGEEVTVWGWNTTKPFTDSTGKVVGRDFGTFTVEDGEITLPVEVTHACIGLAYTARFKSAKQAFAAALGTPLSQRGRIDHLGLVLADTHVDGISFGPDFDHLDSLPTTDDEPEVNEDGEAIVDSHLIHTDYDKPMIPFDGEWATDSRVCLQAQSPRPATVLAFVASMTKNG